MKAVIQRVSRASVTIRGEKTAEIGPGFVVLLGVAAGDGQEEAEKLAAKIAGLRVCADEKDKMNRSLIDTKGEILVISNFTLCADCAHGRRPSFIKAARPEEGRMLYEYFTACLEDFETGGVRTGEFGADMQVDLCNDGPVTLVLDTKEL